MRLVIKKTQFQVVWNKLKTTGRVSRNWCLRRNITRLAEYMRQIKASGVKFSTGTRNGKDYVYILKSGRWENYPAKIESLQELANETCMRCGADKREIKSKGSSGCSKAWGADYKNHKWK